MNDIKCHLGFLIFRSHTSLSQSGLRLVMSLSLQRYVAHTSTPGLRTVFCALYPQQICALFLHFQDRFQQQALLILLKKKKSAVNCCYSPAVRGAAVGFRPWAHGCDLQRKRRGHAKMLFFFMSLAAHLNWPCLLWQPSEKIQGCEHSEINWFTLSLSNVRIACFCSLFFFFRLLIRQSEREAADSIRTAWGILYTSCPRGWRSSHLRQLSWLSNMLCWVVFFCMNHRNRIQKINE